MQTINLQTIQNVIIEYELATLVERVMAMVVDLVVVVGGYLLLTSMLLSFMKTGWLDYSLSFLSFATLMIFFILYHFLFELLRHGQSLGKQLLRIQVVRLDGEDTTAGDSILRALFYFVDLLSSVGILGGLLISTTANKQRFGDMAAGTTIIRINKTNHFHLTDILHISSLKDYTPQYPKVRHFNEKDMLLIKNALSRYRRYPNSAHRELVYNLAQELAIRVGETDRTIAPQAFLKKLIQDYIVLTR